MIQLRGGHTTQDPRLDRLPQWDERSKGFRIRDMIGKPALREKRWRLPERLDQGQEGSCFPAGTLVEMADGSHKPIEDVRTLDVLRTAEGNEGTVVATQVRMAVDGLVRLTLRGHAHLRATAEHPILTRRGYVPVCELRIGDEVRLPAVARQGAQAISTALFVSDGRRPAKVGKRTYANARGRGGGATEVTVTRAPDEIQLTAGFGEIVGLWLAEGSATSARLSWHFGGHELDTLAARLIELLRVELGAHAHAQVRGNGAVVVNLYGKHWRLLFERLLSRGPYDKRLPGELMDGPRDFLAGVLKGWLDGDGHFRRGNWMGVTVSHDLAMSMYRIGQVLGLVPTIQCRPPSPNRHAKTRRDRWEIGFNSDPGRARATVDDGGAWRKVVGLEHEEWAGHVFNVHVEGDNSYIAEGVGVHNCVGHGWAHELAAEPVRVRGVTHATALSIYHRAQQLDEWAGEAYDGTSVLAGAKAVQESGHLLEYRWAFSLEDVLATLASFGPVVIGVDWMRGMMDTDANGYITPTGGIVGGHCTLLRGLFRERRRWVCLGRQSWGIDWGLRGDFKLTADDLGVLLENSGEACVPVSRA